jgi:threonine dehydratase
MGVVQEDIASLKSRLTREILTARERVYHVGERTPLEDFALSGTFRVFVKREDLSPINAYKWRGAYNAMKILTGETPGAEVVAASAGNHAQGVAMAASRLGVRAKIFMPLSTPLMKRSAVERLGGNNVEIVLEGDDYNVAAAAAKNYVAAHACIYVHPFDDLYTIAGQATIADEIILSGKGPFDYAFLQIGGGGMAAGVATWLKLHYPGIRIVGVEANGQACMTAAFEAGEPVTLEKIDAFCDGTAVIRAGDLSYRLCREVMESLVTVTNEEVCAAIQKFWEIRRILPETAGALGLAGLIRYAADHPGTLEGKKILTVVSGANVDFGKLPLIVSNSAIGGHRRRYYRFCISEESGTLLSLLESVFPDVNVAEFQYGKTSRTEAWPVVAFEADAARLEQLHRDLAARGIAFEDVTGQADIRYRVVNYDPALFHDPLFMHINFPERRGALRDFMRKIRGLSNVCYFNYTSTGESIGRALMGFEFDSADRRARFLEAIRGGPVTCEPVDPRVTARMLAGQASGRPNGREGVA